MPRFSRQQPRTYYGPSEMEAPLYRPLLRLPARFEGHFRPTMVTDNTGALADDVAEDLGRAMA